MNDEANKQPSIMFWIIAGAALAWNLIGMYFYYLQVTLDPRDNPALTDPQQTFLINYASWATSAFAIAVTAGVAACVLLLLRKSLALIVFYVSLAGVLIQNIYAFGFANGMEVWGTAGLFLPSLIIIVGIAMILYTRSAIRRGVVT